MAEETQPPTREQLRYLLERLLPPNEEMDHESALIILDRTGVDRAAFAQGLKSRLERKVEELKSNGEAVPPALLKAIDVL